MKVLSTRKLQVTDDVAMSSLGALLSSMAIKTNMSAIVAGIKKSPFFCDFPGLVKQVKFIKYSDNSWQYIVYPPTSSSLIKHYAKDGLISNEDIKQIAELRTHTMNARDIVSAMRTIAATAKNMMVTVQ